MRPTTGIRRSLAISVELGKRPGMAVTYGQLGLLAEARQQPAQAMDWMVLCVALFDQFPHPLTKPAPVHLYRLTRQLGLPALEQAWQQATGKPLPALVRELMTGRPDSSQDQGQP